MQEIIFKSEVNRILSSGRKITKENNPPITADNTILIAEILL